MTASCNCACAELAPNFITAYLHMQASDISTPLASEIKGVLNQVDAAFVPTVIHGLCMRCNRAVHASVN